MKEVQKLSTRIHTSIFEVIYSFCVSMAVSFALILLVMMVFVFYDISRGTTNTPLFRIQEKCWAIGGRPYTLLDNGTYKIVCFRSSLYMKEPYILWKETVNA